jgi:TPP-dependent trihydroxycyclohexane-1,2-dione (THcHDO) dehydratase
MKTVRLTVAQALVRWLWAQPTVIDDIEQPLFGWEERLFNRARGGGSLVVAGITVLSGLEAPA